VEVNCAAALKLSGIEAVVTALDIGDQIPTIPIRLAPIAGLERYLQPVIAHGKVRYVGEPIAVVIARSRAIAEDALAQIDVAIEAIDPVANWRAAEADETLLFEQNGTNIAARYTVGFGDPDQAFVTADYIRAAKFHSHRHTAVPLETRGIVAEYDATADRLIVTGATKVNFFNRRALAAMLQMPETAMD
jgi:carbon-monoxide dehydrogenase large subunit